MVDQAKIHRKVVSGDVEERIETVEQLLRDFADLPNRNQAWEDLIRMTGGEDGIVRWRAAEVLGCVFSHVPDKKQAWDDLIRLTGDKDSSVRMYAAHSLGHAFPHVPEKWHAWKDLIRLTLDEDSVVQVSANHSLGRASIFKATETESGEKFRVEIKSALEFFKRSSKGETYYNPSRFCLPFYRSFYMITFEKQKAEDEVQKYLADAKSASEGSKNKEILLEAVENLANALSEAHKVTDFNAMKSDLNTLQAILRPRRRPHR